MSERLFLLDGTALIYRAHFAMIRNPLTTADGTPVSAVYGLASTMLQLVRQERPDYLAVAFDLPGPTFRNALYAAYKAHRAEMPEELVVQQPLVRELVRAWPCPVIEMSGFEADDVLGSYAAQLAGPDLQVVLVTGDKDFYQLLGEHVRIMNPGRGGAAAVEQRLLGPDDIPDKFGVTEPRQVVDVLALMGDTSDNVPGVPGIGPKTAGKLIADFGSLDALYRDVDRVMPPRIREKLLAHRDAAVLAHELVTIRTDLDLPEPLEALRVRAPGGDALRAFLDRMQFRSLAVELNVAGAAEEPEAVTGGGRHDGYGLVQTERDLVALARRLADARDGFAFDTETTGVDPMRAELVGLALAAGPGEAWYVNVDHAGGTPVGAETTARVLGPVLADPDLPKVAHHAKYDLLVLERAGIPVRGVAFDTMIASYLLDPERSHKLDNLALDLLEERMIPITDLIGKGAKQISMRDVDPETACRYAAEDADMTLRLRGKLAPEIESSGMTALLRDVEMPLALVLEKMEKTGVRVDRAFLVAMSARLKEEMERLEAKCRELAGTDFNVNSPQQLADVLFVRLGLPTGKKTKTGWSTDSEVLEGLLPLHGLPATVLEYRQVMKLKSTYVDTLPTMIHPETGRVHTSFSQTVAATGRLSSSDPNLQNIPIRTPLGREVRRAFVPGEEGWVLLSADYSQIELRIMAHLSRDPALVKAFQGGGDVHRATAGRLFGVKPENVTDEQRAQAKTVNFGILYGQGPYGLARTLGIPNREASAFIKAYKEQYRGVVDYLDGTLEAARRQGYVTTLLGRRRFLPGLRSKGGPARAAAERLAVNTPIQGSAADLIKVAMVALDRRLVREGFAARLLLQVHDELLLECPAAEAERLGTAVREEMESAIALDVPVLVNIGVGANWAEIH